MEIKEEIGKVIAIRKKAICSNCGTEMSLCGSSPRVLYLKGFKIPNVVECCTKKYVCKRCGYSELSDELYPDIILKYVFDDDEAKS